MDFIWLVLDAILWSLWWVALGTTIIVVGVVLIILGLVGLYTLGLGRGDGKTD